MRDHIYYYPATSQFGREDCVRDHIYYYPATSQFGSRCLSETENKTKDTKKSLLTSHLILFINHTLSAITHFLILPLKPQSNCYSTTTQSSQINNMLLTLSLTPTQFISITAHVIILPIPCPVKKICLMAVSTSKQR